MLTCVLNREIPKRHPKTASMALAEFRGGRGPARHCVDALNGVCPTPGHAPNAVRLALAAPTMDQLDSGLRTLASLLNASEADFDSIE
jgi:hypothetical protein